MNKSSMNLSLLYKLRTFYNDFLNFNINTDMQEPPIIFTDSAALKVGSLLKDEKNSDLNLRVYVTGGGCAGFQYGFSFDENKEDGDTTVIKQGVSLIVDPMSIQYLMGAEIDFQEDLQGARFVIKNPNANTTCSCGSSFS